MAGKRYSRQRELIYNAVRSSKEHPTAEMVYELLRAENPNLSLGTVYRNLNLLAEEGLLLRLSFPVDRFDGCVEPHTHFRCDKCGRVLDLDVPFSADFGAVEAAEGIKIRRHELIFYGLCPDCREENPAAEDIPYQE